MDCGKEFPPISINTTSDLVDLDNFPGLEVPKNVKSKDNNSPAAKKLATEDNRPRMRITDLSMPDYVFNVGGENILEDESDNYVSKLVYSPPMRRAKDIKLPSPYQPRDSQPASPLKSPGHPNNNYNGATITTSKLDDNQEREEMIPCLLPPNSVPTVTKEKIEGNHVSTTCITVEANSESVSVKDNCKLSKDDPVNTILESRLPIMRKNK